MIVDRRKDSLDELLILARDSRMSRDRARRWTVGLVAGGMVASGAYVATVNQEIHSLKETTQDAVGQRDTMRSELDKALRSRDAAAGERDIYKGHIERNAKSAPSVYLGDQITKLAEKMSAATGAPAAALSGVVWLVDGERSFPMTKNDYLWVPEAGTWVQLTDSNEPGRVKVYKGEDAALRGSDRSNVREQTLPLTIDVAGRGNANYACLSFKKPTERPGFGSDYGDMTISFQSVTCRTSN